MTSKNNPTPVNTIKLSRLALIIITICLSANAFAQIVSLDERRTEDPSKGVQGDVQFVLNYTESSNKVLQSGAKLNLQLNDSNNTYVIYSDIDLSRTDGENDLNDGKFGAIYNYKAEDRKISAEGIFQYEYDGNNSLKHRYLLGGGPRWKIVDKDGLKLSVVAYTIYFNEKYQGTVTSQKSMAKFSTMMSFSTNISENSSITHNTYYEPNYSNPGDYRIESETTFKTKFNKKFSYRIYLNLNYVSVVPDGVVNFDYALQNSLSFSF